MKYSLALILLAVVWRPNFVSASGACKKAFNSSATFSVSIDEFFDESKDGTAPFSVGHNLRFNLFRETRLPFMLLVSEPD